ncbi:MAG: hypothetical protein SGARI_005498 [Bacillariaceae sp.]
MDQEFVERIRSVVRKEGNAVEDWRAFWDRRLDGQEGQKKKSGQQAADTAITEAHRALQTILRTKLVVGFHPDQATDYCFELAEILGIPWCIVPCCVFPAEFPNRQCKDGELVRDYKQLIEYIREKCPEAKTGFLDFHFTETAKNLVLYTTKKHQNHGNQFLSSLPWAFNRMKLALHLEQPQVDGKEELLNMDGDKPKGSSPEDLIPLTPD